jgi:hypothetical protein
VSVMAIFHQLSLNRRYDDGRCGMLFESKNTRLKDVPWYVWLSNLSTTSWLAMPLEIHDRRTPMGTQAAKLPPERNVSPVPAVRSASRNSVHTTRKSHGRTVHELPIPHRVGSM